MAKTKFKISLGLLIAVTGMTIAGLSSLGVATFAFFDAAAHAQVKTLDIGTDDGSFLKFGFKNEESESGYEWYDSIDQDVLADHGTDVSKVQLLDVSSMYESTWKTSTTDLSLTPELKESYQFAGSILDTPKSTKGFVQFELYFLSNHYAELYLGSGSSLLADTGENAIKAYQLGVPASDLNAVQDCARVSFFSRDRELNNRFTIWEPNVSASSNTTMAGRLDTDGNGYFEVDSEGKEQLYGEYNHSDPDMSLVYDDSARVDYITGDKDGFNALSYPSSGEKTYQYLDIDKSISDGNLEIAHETTYTLGELSDSNSGQFIAFLEPDLPTRMVVSIYLEGWDRDTVDSIYYAKFGTALQFTAIEVPAI